MSAASQVLTTPELLEMILVSLPIRDLLRAHRVSTTWHDAIDSSIRASRHLFREPQPPADTLQGVSPPPPTANPFPNRYRWKNHDMRLSRGVLAELKGVRRREMYVCQPPVQRLEVFGRLHGGDSTWQWREILKPDGVKIKHLGWRVKKLPEFSGFIEIVGSGKWRRAEGFRR